MSTFFEDENCNTVIWDSFKIDLCWSLKLSDPQNKKFKEPLFSDMPLSNDTIIVTVKCNEHVDKEIEFEIVELIDGIATPKSSIIYSGKVKANDDKGTEIALKKAKENNTYIVKEKTVKGAEESFKCYDNPVKVGKEVLKGVGLYYKNWDVVKFEDFCFTEEAKSRRVNEYIKMRLETEEGKNGITNDDIPKEVMEEMTRTSGTDGRKIIKINNGLKGIINKDEKYRLYITDLPLVYQDDELIKKNKKKADNEKKYKRANGMRYKDTLYISTCTEANLDLVELFFEIDTEAAKSLTKGQIIQGIAEISENSGFVKSGLFDYLYGFEEEQAAKDEYFEAIKAINKNKKLTDEEKANQKNILGNKLRERRIKLNPYEYFMSTMAHEETHFYTSDEYAACYVEMLTLKLLRNKNTEE